MAAPTLTNLNINLFLFTGYLPWLQIDTGSELTQLQKKAADFTDCSLFYNGFKLWEPIFAILDF
jgi:hypothetical protein